MKMLSTFEDIFHFENKLHFTYLFIFFYFVFFSFQNYNI